MDRVIIIYCVLCSYLIIIAIDSLWWTLTAFGLSFLFGGVLTYIQDFGGAQKVQAWEKYTAAVASTQWATLTALQLESAAPTFFLAAMDGGHCFLSLE